METINDKIKLLARLELVKRDFFEYCKLTSPDFYKNDRAFIYDACNQLQDFYESDDKICVINMPPRHRQVSYCWKIC